MKKRKIAFCVRDMQVGGVEAVMLRTLDALLKSGDFEIIVITYMKITEPMYKQWFDAHPQVKVYNLYPSKFLGTKLPHFFLARLFVHLMRDAYRFVRRVTMNVHRFDDVDVFIDYYNFSFAREFKKFNRPKIVWWHSSIDVFLSGGYVKYMNGYDMLVTLTDGFVDVFRNTYPRLADKIMRIYNPIDVASVIGRAADVPEFNGEKYFCCVSRLAPDKDIKTVLRAFDMFWNRAGRVDVKLVICGGGSCSDEFKNYASGLSACCNIVFTGPVTNPFGIMHFAIAHILSSYSEGMPTVLVEAAAVSTLNIASDCNNGPREILMDGAAGMLYAPGDADGLAKCMMDVWNGDVDAAQMIKTATKNLSRFDAATITPQIVKLINRFADK